MTNYPTGSHDTPPNQYTQSGAPQGYEQLQTKALEAPYGRPPQAPYTTPMQTPYAMQPQAPFGMQTPAAPYVEQKSKVAAALLAFFLGGFGAHGFYLGNSAMGVTILLIYLISWPLLFVGIGVLGLGAVSLICFIQTILYLATSDNEFYHKYVVSKRWF